MIRGKISLRRCDGPLLHRTRGEMFLFPGKLRKCIAAIVKKQINHYEKGIIMIAPKFHGFTRSFSHYFMMCHTELLLLYYFNVTDHDQNVQDLTVSEN